jgi:hypothetical protein
MHPPTPRARSFVRLALATALACLATACPAPPPPGDGGDAGGDGAAASPPGITARFTTTRAVPRPFEIPFPSDIYRAADGTLLDDIENFSAIGIQRNGEVFATAFRDLDGFGLSTGAMFLIDSTPATPGGAPFQVDPASLPADGAASLAPGASAMIIDLAPDLAAAAARVPCAAGWQSPFRLVTVQPDQTVLTPGHRYAVVLTTDVRATQAPAALRAAPSFAAIRDAAPGSRTGALGMLYGAAVDRVVTVMGPG